MFTKTKLALAVAITLGTASAALATGQSKHVRHLRNPAVAAFAMTSSNQYHPQAVMPFTQAEKRAFDYQNSRD